MIKCCMFDLDGTLLDTLKTITYYVNETLQKYGIKPITEDECKKFVGDGTKILFERIFSSRGVNDADLCYQAMLEYKVEYDKEPYYLTKAYDGMPELISALLSKGIRLAVLSNKPHSATEPIISRYFPNSFEKVRGVREVYPVKPNPAVAFELLEEMSLKPDEVMYIGDTNVDMQTGKNFGAGLTVGVLWGFRDKDELVSCGADITVSHPDMILREVSR